MLAVVYLIFNEGYTASTGDELTRADLCAEAIRLGRLLARLMPDEPEVTGLLALMLLTESRRPPGPARTGAWSCWPARTGAAGTAGSSPRDRRSSGSACAGDSLARTRSRRPSTRCMAIAGPARQATDWGQILQLYDQLLAIAPSPVAALHRAVAVAEVDGPAAALALVDELGTPAGQGSGPSLAGYYLFHAIRAGLLRGLGRDGRGGRRLRRGPGPDR